MTEIEAPQLSPVHFDTIRIIEIVAQEKAQEICLARLDHLLETRRRIGLVANEHDLLDSGSRALLDLEYEIDALVRQLDDLGFNVHVEAAAATIDIGHTDSVALHHGPRQRSRGFRLQLASQLVVLDVLVSLERHPVDHRVFHDSHDQTVTHATDADILKQAGGKQLLQSSVCGHVVKPPAGLHTKVGADRLGFDPAVAFDNDG